MALAKTPPGTPAKIEKAPVSTPCGSRVKEEKIFVTVRVRPLSKKEQSLRDQVAWECVDGKTILYKGPTQDRASPSSYTFDKVFGPTCLTETVYDEGAKNVALSALTGINATIFAYGQTSSGKTYTMRGVTESAINDIYKHIQNTPEREFTIKISAMEIYNEIVRDLLRPDSGPLRLLDDPEKGTIVEKLEEETARDSLHLRHLISICEAQRQVGETALNDTSSRSHQIIRLMVESSLRENSGCVKSFVASLNFVDLAGSERASQTHANGTRLKEGCHINQSLLTLMNVIRELGKRSDYIPYRRSKLTRVLQLSLGGNARTAIICTMSPALAHVEQSRNTLLFASSAKEVTNTAEVNMVISDKQLVKHLQKEVARLEAELRTPEPSGNSNTLLMEKEKKIKKMELEMEEVKKERDLAKSELDELLKKLGDNQLGLNPFDLSPLCVAKCLTFSSPSPQLSGKTKRNPNPNPLWQSCAVPSVLVHEIRKLEQLQQQLGEEANRALEVLQKEVHCHRLGNQDAAEAVAKLLAEIREMRKMNPVNDSNRDVGDVGPTGQRTSLREEVKRLNLQESSIANLEAQLENMQRFIDQLMTSLPSITGAVQCCGGEGTMPKSGSLKSHKKKKAVLPLALSSNVNRDNLLQVPCSPLSTSSRKEVVGPTEEGDENRAPPATPPPLPISEYENNNNPPSNETPTPGKSEGEHGSTPGSGGGGGGSFRRLSSVNMRKMRKMYQNAAEENVRSIRAYVTELKERIAKLQYQKQLLVCQVLELEVNEESVNQEIADGTSHLEENCPESWNRIFQEQMCKIMWLWDECHVSIIHRTQFYLLFCGDCTDQIYIEVELRRLTWLHHHFAEACDSSPALVLDSNGGNEPSISISSSIKALRNEREFLAKRIKSRLTDEERERLYIKWNVPLEGKQRKLQLVNKLWTDLNDPAHIEESADVVARLVGFCEGQQNVAKEMFELNFAVPSNNKPWLLGWQPISNLLLKL